MDKKMAIWIIGISSLGLIIGIFLLGYTDKKWDGIAYVNKKWDGISYVHWIAIGAIAVGVLNLFREMKSSEKTTSILDTAKETQREVVALRTQNDQLNALSSEQKADIKELKKENKEFRKENKELSTKLSGQALKIYNHATGGDDNSENYPYLTFWEAGDNQIEVTLMSGKKYPLYDIQIQITDLPQYPTQEQIREAFKNNITIKGGRLQQHTFFVAEIAANRQITLGQFTVSHIDKYCFFIDFLARNGDWHQTYKVTNDPTKEMPLKYHIESKIYTGGPNNHENRGTLIDEFDSAKDGPLLKFIGSHKKNQ